MLKTLVLFTSYFPFDKGEAFIENEFPFLYRNFERVIIVTSELKSQVKRPIPKNVIIIRYPYYASFPYKVRAVCAIASKYFADELNFIRTKLKFRITKNILFTLLGSIAKGFETRDFILNEIVKKYSLSLSETRFYSYWMDDIAIGLAMLKENYPVVKTFCRAHRGDLYFYANADNYLPLRPFMLSHLNACYVISKDGKRYLTELAGEKVTSNVVVSKLGTFLQPKLLKFERQDVFVLVSCSTFTPPKRIQLIAEAISKLTNIKLKWLHFGEGALREKVEQETKNLLSNKEGIEFAFMDVFYNADLLRFYSENPIDLFINVSSSEGIPVSIMEAMSFGIPVIATDTGATNEIVKDGYNGYLLKVADTADEVAASIKKYISLSDLQKSEMSQHAFDTWKENYDGAKNYQEFIDSLAAL